MPLLLLRSSVVSSPPQQGSLPSWLDGAPKRWGIVPGTDTGTIEAVKTNPSLIAGTNNNPFVFSGAAVDQTEGVVYVHGGGHGDYQGNEIWSIALRGESAAWQELFTRSTGDLEEAADYNSSGSYEDGSKVTDHTYRIMHACESGELYFGGFGAMASSLGYPSTACWKWRLADINNGSRGFTFLGKAHATYDNTTQDMVQSCSAYDPTRKTYWLFSQHAIEADSEMPEPIWSIDTTTDQITLRETIGGTDSTWLMWATCIPSLDILLVGGSDNKIYRMNLTTFVWTECTVTGTGITAGSSSGGTTWNAEYYPAGHQLIGWTGDDLLVCDLPDEADGTYAWRTVEPVAGGETPPESIWNAYSRFNVVHDMGDGTGMAIWIPDVDEPVYFFALGDGI